MIIWKILRHLPQDEKWPNFRGMAGWYLMPHKYHLVLHFCWRGSISMGKVLYSTKWVKYSNLPCTQHKTQPQHTTTNMSRRRSTLQQLWPSLSMATSSMDPNLSASAPYGSLAGAGRPVCSCRSSILRLGCWNTTNQKQREGWGLSLRWLPFSYFTQQPTKRQCRQWGGDWRRDATGVEYVGGKVCLLFRPSNWVTKYNWNKKRCGLRWPPNNESTQQPTKNTRAQPRGYREIDSTRRECGGSMIPSFWGQLSLE